MRQEILWVAVGDHRPRFGVEKYTVVADGKNTRELMCNYDNSGAQTVAQFQNQFGQ
jgi:hypothetical protein